MPDWDRFRRAFIAGPNVEILRRIRIVEPWLALSQDEALAALKKEMAEASEPQGRLLYQALCVLRMKLQRDLGIPVGLESQAKMQQFFVDVEQGRGSDRDRQYYQQFSTSYQLSSALLQAYLSLGQSLSPAELAQMELRNSLTAVFNRLSAAAQNCSPGMVSAESIHELEEILEVYRGLVETAEPDNLALPEVFYALGHTALLLAKSNVIFGRNDEGYAGFGAAAQYFEKGGDPAQAADCRNRAKELAQSLSADLDKSAERHLKSLIMPESDAEPLERARALVSLTEVASNAGDFFEAKQNAEAAAEELSRLGFKDPLVTGVDYAVDSWIATASASISGTPLFERISSVGTWYCSIFNARLAAVLREKPQEAAPLDSLLAGVIKALMEVQHQAAGASAEFDQEWAIYAPAAPGPPSPAEPCETETQETMPAVESDRGYDALLQRMRDIDSELLKLRQECNNRTAGQPKEDLLAAAEQLQKDAAALHIPVYDAKTRLERTYILLSLGRAQEVVPLALEARAILLGGRAPSLGSFSQGNERTYYLESLSRQVIAQVILQDFEGAWKTCEETIRDFETQRYRVNSPYRQSAILSAVAEFYTHGAFAAYKLQRWNDMLEAIELIKARSAIRSRLIPDPPELSESDLVREFEQTSAALEAQHANGGKDGAELVDRRRRLWDMLAIARAGSGAVRDLQELRLESLQSALADDEALIGYFWMSEHTVLVMCVDRNRFEANRVNLEPRERGLLDSFVSFVQTLEKAYRSMDTTVAKLGAMLLPQFCRDFVAGKKRLILSPHHSLHLFPFHASSWDDEYLGTRFAVRYVPNFSSLLLPWEKRCENRVLAIAIKDFIDPVAHPQLKKVEDDALAIQQCYTARGIPVEVITGKDATRERVEQLRAQNRLSRFRCIHLGTHGMSVFETPDRPMESSLVLQNGTLDAMDIAALRFEAELVVLSACHSGQRAIAGRDLGELPGDDIFGLQSALFQSGVRSILGTLWHVETESCSVLIRAFHRHYAEGNSAETALQLAIKDYLWNPPLQQREIYYWAPYFISSLGSMAPAP